MRVRKREKGKWGSGSLAISCPVVFPTAKVGYFHPLTFAWSDTAEPILAASVFSFVSVGLFTIAVGAATVFDRDNSAIGFVGLAFVTVAFALFDADAVFDGVFGDVNFAGILSGVLKGDAVDDKLDVPPITGAGNEEAMAESDAADDAAANVAAMAAGATRDSESPPAGFRFLELIFFFSIKRERK